MEERVTSLSDREEEVLEILSNFGPLYHWQVSGLIGMGVDALPLLHSLKENGLAYNLYEKDRTFRYGRL